MSSLLKKLLLWAVPAPWDIWSWFQVVAPVVFAGLTVLAGYFQGVPIFHLMVGGLLAFAAASTGLLRFSEWAFNRRVQGKVNFHSVRNHFNWLEPGYHLGFQLESSADFPLECIVRRIETRIGNTVPAESSVLPQTLEIPPRGSMWFDDMLISVEPPKPGRLQGHVEFEVEYGRHGERKYPLKSKKIVILAFNEQGLLLGGNWADAQ